MYTDDKAVGGGVSMSRCGPARTWAVGGDVVSQGRSFS